MFGRRSTEPEPEGRYHVELAEGIAPVRSADAFQPQKVGMYYGDARRDIRQRVQSVLDRVHARGWKLVNFASPAATLSVCEGIAGCASPTLRLSDTEG